MLSIIYFSITLMVRLNIKVISLNNVLFYYFYVVVTTIIIKKKEE